MENAQNKINPFTNQPILPTPPHNLQEEIKPTTTSHKKTKPANKFNKPEGDGLASNSQSHFKIIFLYIILSGLGVGIAKYAFDFFTPKLPFTIPYPLSLISKSAPNKLASQSKTTPPLSVPFAPPTKPPPSPLHQQTESLVSLKKKINPAITPYILSGILLSDNQSYCIINDKILEKGDSIENAKVIKIDTEEVELQLKNKPEGNGLASNSQSPKTIKLNLRGW